MAPFPSVFLTITTVVTYISLKSQPTHSIDVAESNTGAVLEFPSVIDGALYNQSYEVAPAQFGYQRYGGSMEGVLILPSNTSYHKECPPSQTCPDCAQEPIETNPFIHYIKDWFVSPEDITDYILIIDRLDCYFVQKIEWAQNMGAKGVIMCDWKSESLFTMWMPEDWTDDIHIPSVLLQRDNCATLMSHLGVINWDPSNIASTQYPTPESITWTIATIKWGLPHDDDRVEWELWTSSNDYLGSEFKHNFNSTAIMLDKANDTLFTPHMYILNGSHWGCPGSGLPCRRQCSNSGRYCAVDPEYDLSLGLDGIDVIQENLRQLCVWQYDTAMKGVMDDVLWWDYAVLWDEHCGVYSNSTLNFDATCAYAQMDKLDSTQGLSAFVQNCISASGGYDYHGGVNAILETETKLKYNSSIYALPMVRVNEFLIHGNMDCPPPVTQHNCEILAAICAGFIDGTQPNVCDLTPAPTFEHCNGTDKDCAGVCHGTHEFDACHKCLLVSDHTWNECIGCNAQINETYDCDGICGGHYAVNPCGYCKDTRLNGWAAFGIDCRGTCAMELRTDECGQCLPESDPLWNACVGCDNIPNSGLAFNDCGRCLNASLPNFANFGKDCEGVCDGMKESDECGQCLAISSVDWNNCVGCDGIPFSNKSFNECGRCIDTNDVNFDNIGKDCRGLCATNAEMYEFDECGQCLLPSESEFNHCCGGNKNKQFNICGLCLWANATDFAHRGKDCTGECHGLFTIDACGQCLLSTDARFDACMHCENNETRDCNDMCAGNHAINECGQCIDAELPNFNDYGKDCAGMCDGTALSDECGMCAQPSSAEWNECVGCDGIAHSDMAVNECGLCILSSRTDFESKGRDCAGECNGEYRSDDCGECVLPNSAHWNDCYDCDGVANGDKRENECKVCASVNDLQFNDYGRDCTGECALTAVTTHYIDECGQCLLPIDESWNDCVNDRASDSNNGNGNGNGTVDTQMILIISIAIVAVVVLCIASVIIFYLCQKHREMKRQFDEIKEIYKPMHDLAAVNQTKGEQMKRTTMTTVPDQESE